VKRRHTTTRRQRSRNPAIRLREVPNEGIHAEPTALETDSQTEILPVARSISYADIEEIQGPVTRIIYDPIYDAQLTIQQQLRHLQNLTLDRRRVLELALNSIGLLSSNSRDLIQGSYGSANVETSLKYPSIEFLTWMLKGILH
jgi:hypothetical protein